MPKIVQYNLPPGGTVTQLADGQSAALEIEGSDGKDYLIINTVDGSEQMEIGSGSGTSDVCKVSIGANPGTVGEIFRVRQSYTADSLALIENTGAGDALHLSSGTNSGSVKVLKINNGSGEVWSIAADGDLVHTGTTQTIGPLATALTGTFTATNGSAEITSGSSTAFTTELHVGSAVELFEGSTSRGVFTVSAIGSGTALTLDSTVSGLSSSPKTGMTGKTDGGELFAVKTGDGKSVLAVNSTGVLTLSTSSGVTSSLSNIAIGDAGLLDAIEEDGVLNTIIAQRSSGSWALSSAANNVVIGFGSGLDMTNAQRNVAIGTYALDDATSTQNSVAIGTNCGRKSGNDCVYIGHNTGDAATGAHNTAIGKGAFSATSAGTNNVAIGRDAMSAFTGSDSIAIGKEALDATSSARAVSVGYQSLTGLTATTTDNTAVGHQAGDGLDDGNECLFLGSGADTTDADGDNQIAIGYGAVCDAPNKIMMGNHRSVDMTMDCPPITVKQTSTSGPGISLEHEGSTATIAHIGEDGDGGWLQLSKAGTVEHKFVCSGSSFINSDTTRNFGVGNASPSSTFHNFGETALAISGVSSSAAADAGASTTQLVDTTSGDVTITLPAKSGCTSRIYIFKKKVAANNMIIAGNGSETIDGAGSLTFASIYDSVAVQCSGTEWHVLWKYEP